MCAKRAKLRPQSLQRDDYPATGQDSWYLLRFVGCSKCSLSGGGTIDGGARKWVLPKQPGGSEGRRLRELAVGPASLNAAEEARPEDQRPKAVHNWDDPSCSDPTQCR